jgi:peptidyl-prolyl cis-trans isomerase SurA
LAGPFVVRQPLLLKPSMTHFLRLPKRAALLTIVLLAFTVTSSLAQLGIGRPVGATIVDGIIAKIDNQIVLRSDLENIYAQEVARAEGKPLPPDLKCRIMQSLALNKLCSPKPKPTPWWWKMPR